MRISRNTFCVLWIAALTITSTAVQGATMNISFVENQNPPLSPFSCILTIEKGKVSFLGTGLSCPQDAFAYPYWYGFKFPRFRDHVVTIEDEKIAAEFLTIVKHFELCHEGWQRRKVDGGFYTKIECLIDPDARVKEAFYIALDPIRMRANLMDGICRNVQMIVASDFVNGERTKKKALEALRVRLAKLSSNIAAYTEAYSLLEEAQKNGDAADWTKILGLVQIRPCQPALEKRSRLVRSANDVLTASCSERGLERILGRDSSDDGALILKIGKVRRALGSFTLPENADSGFDDVRTSLGFAYPPHDPTIQVAILDWGVERLILHFVLQGIPDASTAYDRYSLALTGRTWEVIDRWNFRETPLPEGTKDRLHDLSSQSGLLEHLLEGDIPDEVTYLDVQEIVFEDDNWKAARLDYRLGDEQAVLPLFLSDGAWLPNRRWTGHSYRQIENVYMNSDFFRPFDEIKKHNAEENGTDPATTR